MATFKEKQQLAGTTHRRLIEAVEVIRATGGERERWLWETALADMGRVLDYYGTEMKQAPAPEPAGGHDDEDEQGAGE